MPHMAGLIFAPGLVGLDGEGWGGRRFGATRDRGDKKKDQELLQHQGQFVTSNGDWQGIGDGVG